MGTIRTTGKALREVEYDKMTITMAFNTREKRSKDAIRKVVEECELFLAELKKLGVDISQMRGEENQVTRDEYTEDHEIHAVRTIRWDADYDLALIDAVMRLAEQGSYNVDISVEPRYSRKSELCKELMREAVIDAKTVADSLVEALGTKVKGPSKINASGDYDYITDEEYLEGALKDALACGKAPRNYSDFGGAFAELQKPTMIQTEEITIEWELEA